MVKVIVVIIILVLAYVFFTREDLPRYIDFQSVQFGPKVLQKANDSNSRLFRYNSKSQKNTDYIMLLKPDSDTAPSIEFAELFSAHFSSQGFSFKKQGNKMLGLGSKGVVYMINRPNIDIVVMLMVETKMDEPETILDAASVFYSLSEIQL